MRMSGPGPPKLILHFDIRNTVLVADTATKISFGLLSIPSPSHPAPGSAAPGPYSEWRAP